MQLNKTGLMIFLAVCFAPAVHAHHEEHVASTGLHMLHHILIGVGIAALVAGLIWLYRSKRPRSIKDDN